MCDSGEAKKVRVIKVQAYQGIGGSALILRESEKDLIWEYCADWDGELHLTFTEMPEDEVNALPEFDGF